MKKHSPLEEKILKIKNLLSDEQPESKGKRAMKKAMPEECCDDKPMKGKEAKKAAIVVLLKKKMSKKD